MAHHAAMFSALTPSTLKFTGADKPILSQFKIPFEKNCKGNPCLWWGVHLQDLVIL